MVKSLLFIQYLPLIGALIVLIFSRKNTVYAGILALVVALLEFVLTLRLLPLKISCNTPAVFGIVPSFVFDSLTAITLLIISGVTVITILYSLNVKQEPDKSPSFYSLILLVLFGTTGVALAGDLIQFYVFWEAMLIPAWVLVLYWNEDSARVKYTSLKFFIITHIGAVLMLAAILWLYSITGYTNMSTLVPALQQIPPDVLRTIVILFLMGFIVKLAIFPFHTWLPDAYTTSVMPVTLILVGVMTNIGIYGLARFVPFFPANVVSTISNILLIAALINMLYGGLMALAEKNIKRILAYSSMSQMGYVLFGIATLLPLGVAGSVFNIINQAATKLVLFICVGVVAAYAGTYNIKELGGWGKRLPLVAVCAVAAMLSLVGAPPMLGFWPELLTFSAGFSYGNYVIVVIALIASVISAAYGLRLIRYTFFGALPVTAEGEVIRPHWTVIVSLLTGFVIILVLGVYPAPAFELVRNAVVQLGFVLGG